MAAIHQQLRGTGMPQEAIDKAEMAGVSLPSIFAIINEIMTILGTVANNPDAINMARAFLQMLIKNNPSQAALYEAVLAWLNVVFPPAPTPIP